MGRRAARARAAHRHRQDPEAGKRIHSRIITDRKKARRRWKSGTRARGKINGASCRARKSRSSASARSGSWKENSFQNHYRSEKGPAAVEEWNARARKNKWGVVPRAQEPLIGIGKIRKLESEFIPESLQRDYEKTFGQIGRASCRERV